MLYLNLLNNLHNPNNTQSNLLSPPPSLKSACSARNEGFGYRDTSLKSDVVSFAGSPQFATSLEDILKIWYSRIIPTMQSQGERFIKKLTVIADKFADRGVSLPDAQYMKKGLVKQLDSFISKFFRCGEPPADRIRTTLFVENPYDFKLVRNILDELEKGEVGYVVDKITVKENGKKVKVPDFDIRLPDVAEEDTRVLGPKLMKCIGKPQPTGYEDIQMRLVEKCKNGKSSKNGKPPIELLIMYGKNFAEAKEAESYYSYNIRRSLKKLLHISKVESPLKDSPAEKYRDSVRNISDILTKFISEPLFYNAKNKDYRHKAFQLPVELGFNHCQELEKQIKRIKYLIYRHYSQELKACDTATPKTLEDIVKSSHEYKERKDKTIYAIDLRMAKRNLRKSIKLQKEDDLREFAKIEKNLSETIEKYGVKSPVEVVESGINIKVNKSKSE